MPTFAGTRTELATARAAFRAEMTAAGAGAVWQRFPGRIGLVLSGGGARGAYEAGALLAFQDAALPTHIVAATSIGSVNGATFAAHSATVVGNADRLTEDWLTVTPRALGVEWTRYGWMVLGLIALSAGVGNLLYLLARLLGLEIQLHSPGVAWISVALAGAAVMLFYPQLPYVYFVASRGIRRQGWDVHHRRLRASIVANLVVLAFLVAIVMSLHLHTTFRTLLVRSPLLVGAGVAVLFLLRWVERRQAARVSRLWERLVRAPLATGLFNNFARSRYLRDRIPADPLTASPIRFVVTTTDLEDGSPTYFSNTPLDRLAADPGVDQRFVTREVVYHPDLLPAIVASSALPIAFEPLVLEDRLLSDGAIVGSQPIRPAIRLGADVLFIVLVNPPRASARRDRITFLDVGLRAFDILMHQNLRTDLQTTREANGLCEQAARELGVPPETITIELGHRRFRYIRPFTIRPAAQLGAGILDFGAPATGAMILLGYRDAAVRIREFLAYAPQSHFGAARHVLRMAPA
jgi:predicted acylesterase/phospholipase RssA